MANHRAGKREASHFDAAGSTAAAPVTMDAPARSTGGKRKAVKPSRSSRAAAASRAAAPSRPAPTRSGSRKGLFPALPSTPTLVGATALLVAAAGAVTVGQQGVGVTDGNIQRLSAQANVLNGASGVSSRAALDNRQLAVSRDSQREALANAAAEELQAAAEKQEKERNAALAALAASAEKHASWIAANAWVLPVAPGLYHLTATFGESSGLWAHTHTGLDFAAPTGTPIRAIARGVVTETGYSGAYGNRTIVTLEDGTELWYCHQNAYEVSVGDKVSPGQVIGQVGSTGNVTGPHLHLEVRPGAGDPVDPYNALVAHGVQP